MASRVTIVALLPVIGAGITTPTSINASTQITVPTTAQRVNHGGELECYIAIEGTVTSRYTFNGVTPTAAVGMLLPAPTASVPVQLTIIGEAFIAAFRIIGTAAGDTMTYQFACRDVR